MHDPRLTPLGESQCATLQKTHFPPSVQQSISLVTASPLCRTIHTAHLVFSPALENGKCYPQILAIPDAQETSDFPCDTGSDPDKLRSICAEQGWKVDLSLVKEGWNIKTMDGRYSPASEAIRARARDVRLLLRQKARELAAKGDADVEIVLVTHGGFLHYLTNDWEDADKLSGTAWENCEHRTYVFEDDFTADNDDGAFVLETQESRARRGKQHPMFPREKQEELFHRAMQGWEDQGLQNPAKLGNGASATPLEPEDAEVNEAEVEAQAEGQQPAAKNMTVDRVSGDVQVLA